MTGPICPICNRDATCQGQARERCLAEPWVNVGSGLMLKDDMINYDIMRHHHGGRSTDVLGNIREITNVLPSGYFAGILCAHVIEHFYRTDALSVLADFKALLRPGGKLIIEAPCLAGVYWHHLDNGKGGLRALADSLYGLEAHRLKWGDVWTHKSGWTGEIMAEELTAMGMSVTHIGIGLTHGMGRRDFMVEATK